MKQLFLRLWHDDDGAVSTLEFLLIATILALGVIPGLTAIRNAIVVELTETAVAIDPDSCPDCMDVDNDGDLDNCVTCTPPTSISVIEQVPCQ